MRLTQYFFFLIIQITPTSLQHDYVDPSAVTGSLLTFLWLRRNLWNKLLTRTWGLEETLSFFLLRSVLPVPRLEEKPPCVGSALEGEHVQARIRSLGWLLKWEDILRRGGGGGGGKVSNVASCVTRSPSSGETQLGWWLAVTCGRS